MLNLTVTMSPSHENSRERLQQAIDAEIKSLQESIRACKSRRNALSPISSLPPEVFAAIFSFVCSPLGFPNPPELGNQIRVSHVCRQWREVALGQPLLWRNVDLTALSVAGATEALSRAKSVPLYLKANVSGSFWDDIRFSAFKKQLQARMPNVSHLSFKAQLDRLHETLGGLVSPAPTLEYLSLCSRERSLNTEKGGFVPYTLFNGSIPRLSYLRLFECKISWKSPLLKGLRHLEIRSPIARPKLETWLDALDAMTQLNTLVLRSASPIAASQGDVLVKHNVTLPSLTHLTIETTPANCALVLAHLDLPALTALSTTVYLRPDTNRIQPLLPHLVRHAHGPQDTLPLQSMLICNERRDAKILAWTLPDIDAKVQDPPTFLPTTTPLSARVALYFASYDDLFDVAEVDVLDAAMAALPLSGLVTLVVRDQRDLLMPPNTRVWLDHALKWPLLRCVHLEGDVLEGFTTMLLNGNNGSPPLFPLLKEIVLVGSLKRDWASALRKRVEQGVPLERLDLRMGYFKDDTIVPLLSKIVVDILGPQETSEMWQRVTRRWETVVSASLSGAINLEPEFESYTDDGEDEHHEE